MGPVGVGAQDRDSQLGITKSIVLKLALGGQQDILTTNKWANRIQASSIGKPIQPQQRAIDFGD